MRKMARASIILIAIGAIIFPEAYWAHAGAWDSTRSLRRGSPQSSSAIFLWRGQTMEGNITLSAPASFYILDEASYLAFVEDQSWQPLISLPGISNESFSFVAPTSGYYRIVVDLQFNQIESADLTISVIYYGTDRDHYDSGLAFASAGVFLGIIVLISSLRFKFSAKRAQGTGVEPQTS